MSDVVRNYSWGGSASKRRRMLRRHGTGIAKFLLPVIVVLLVWMLWTTRDSHDMISFISRDHNYEVYINNVIDRRHDIVKSSVWRLLPAESTARSVLDALAGDLPVPEWLLNNMNSGLCHISGPDLENLEAVLVVTRMTRIGCVAERIARLFPAVRHDLAGGLNIYHVPDAGVYYAVRGRTFLLTASRNRLVRALTLEPSDAVSPEEFSEGIRMAGGADIYCRVMPGAWPALSDTIDEMAFAIRFESDSARLMVQAGLTPAFREAYGSLLPATSAEPLPAPFDGMAAISIDLGRPLPEFLEALEDKYRDSPAFPEWFWSSLKIQEDPGIITSFQPLMASIIQTSGSQIRLGWFGMDPMEMLPVPLLAATFDTDSDRVLFLFENILDDAPPSTEMFDLFPRLNEELMLVHAPFVGGPNMEPTLAKFREGIIMSTSLLLAMELQESPRIVGDFNQVGNLYACLRPLEVSEALVAAAHELAVSGLLRGYTGETFESEVKNWVDSAAAVREAALLASWSEGKVRAELKLTMRDAQSGRDTAVQSATRPGEAL